MTYTEPMIMVSETFLRNVHDKFAATFERMIPAYEVQLNKYNQLSMECAAVFNSIYDYGVQHPQFEEHMYREHMCTIRDLLYLAELSEDKRILIPEYTAHYINQDFSDLEKHISEETKRLTVRNIDKRQNLASLQIERGVCNQNKLKEQEQQESKKNQEPNWIFYFGFGSSVGLIIIGILMNFI